MELLLIVANESSEDQPPSSIRLLARSPSLLSWALIAYSHSLREDSGEGVSLSQLSHRLIHQLAVVSRERILPDPVGIRPLPQPLDQTILSRFYSELSSKSQSDPADHSVKTVAAPIECLSRWLTAVTGLDSQVVDPFLNMFPFSNDFWVELSREQTSQTSAIHGLLKEWQEPALAVPPASLTLVNFPQLLALIANSKLDSTLLQQAKLHSMKQLAYGASHEINNPLANIASRAQTLLRDETDPERKRKLAAINQQAFRAHEMIADMMLFAHPPDAKQEQVDLTTLAQSALESLQTMAEEQGTELIFSGSATSEIAVDPNQIKIAIKALIQNGLESNQTGGRVLVEVVSEPDTTRVDVHDQGPGISPEHREHLFDPFFSGREAGRGLGFGLSKAWRIVELHGGQISCFPSPHGGALFQIKLPYEN